MKSVFTAMTKKKINWWDKMKDMNRIFNNQVNEKIKPLAVFDFSLENEISTFSQSDIEKAEAKGYSKGFTEGLELGTSQGQLKANREIDTMVQEVLTKIDLQLQKIQESEKSFSKNFFPNIVKICSSVLQKTMPYFFKKHGKEEMFNLLHDIVGSLAVKSPIKVKVSNNLYNNLSSNIKSVFASYPETIDITGIAEFSDEMCEINWEGGSAEWNLSSRYQEIDSKLQEYLDTYVNEGEHHG